MNDTPPALPPPTPPKKRNIGCWIVLIFLILGFGFMSLTAIGLMKAVSSKLSDFKEISVTSPSSSTITASNKASKDALKIDFREALPESTTPTPELVIRILRDIQITSLTREHFIQSASGAAVQWQLKLIELVNDGKEIRGRFSLPFSASRKDGSELNASLPVTVLFASGQTEQLLRLRRQEWVTISGTLDLSTNDLTIRNAQFTTVASD